VTINLTTLFAINPSIFDHFDVGLVARFFSFMHFGPLGLVTGRISSLKNILQFSNFEKATSAVKFYH